MDNFDVTNKCSTGVQSHYHLSLDHCTKDKERLKDIIGVGVIAANGNRYGSGKTFLEIANYFKELSTMVEKMGNTEVSFDDEINTIIDKNVDLVGEADRDFQTYFDCFVFLLKKDRLDDTEQLRLKYLYDAFLELGLSMHLSEKQCRLIWTALDHFPSGYLVQEPVILSAGKNPVSISLFLLMGHTTEPGILVRCNEHDFDSSTVEVVKRLMESGAVFHVDRSVIEFDDDQFETLVKDLRILAINLCLDRLENKIDQLVTMRAAYCVSKQLLHPKTSEFSDTLMRLSWMLPISFPNNSPDSFDPELSSLSDVFSSPKPDDATSTVTDSEDLPASVSESEETEIDVEALSESEDEIVPLLNEFELTGSPLSSSSTSTGTTSSHYVLDADEGFDSDDFLL